MFPLNNNIFVMCLLEAACNFYLFRIVIVLIDPVTVITFDELL